MSNAISSTVFACKNVGKTEKGEIGRAPVAAAQGVKVIDKATTAVSKHNQTVASATEKIVSILNDAAKESKFVDKALKVTKWATKNVNPLICVSGGLKTLMADDKLSTGITETVSLSTMFLGERTANKLLEKASEHEFKNEILSKAFSKNTKTGAIVHGLLFVIASIASYAIGEHLGKDFAKKVKPVKEQNSDDEQGFKEFIKEIEEARKSKKINQIA